MAERAGCHGCDNAQWDADGCTCRIDGLLVGNSAKGCKYRIHDEKPETVSEDYERGFKDGLKSECLEELKPLMVELAKGCTEAIKGITPMLIDKAHLTIRHAVTRWIPVEDALPEIKEFNISDTVLCYCDSGALAIARLEANGFGQVGFNCEKDDEYHHSVGKVLYWMPIPEIPEPPEKE